MKTNRITTEAKQNYLQEEKEKTWGKIIKNMSDDKIGMHDLLASMSPQTNETLIWRRLLSLEYTLRKNS